jgi:hypothetical protein
MTAKMNHQDGKLSRRRLLAFLPLSSIAASVCAVAARSTATQIGPEQKDPGARFYNITDFGAIGDGVTLNTVAIQKAIDTCAHENGGTVLVPAGEFVTGTIELKSNITLKLAAKGRLLGSPKIEHYKAGNNIPPSNGNVVMISAANAENIRIEGPGTIDGNGAKFFTGRGDMTGPGQNSSAGYYQRPHLLVFYRCQNLSLRDVFLTASAYHCVRILQCQHLVLDGVRIHNRVNLNNDGFHINSSQYVHISNCDVACQDDACALFGSNKFITVTNCTFSTRWSVFRFGGGEAENITISNCVIYDTYGCPIKARFGARSRFENVSFSNLVMRNVTGPISLGLDSTRRNANADTQPAPRGVIRNIKFNGIRAVVVAEGKQHDDLPWPQKFRPGEARQCIVLNGVGEDFLENISFQDVHVTYEGGGTAAEAHREVPKLAGEYFEIGTPPAYAIYARNVRGLVLNNVRFEVQTPDLRPALIFQNVSDAAVSALSAESDAKAESLLRFTNVRETLLSACRMLTAGPAFLHLIGPDNASIKIDGGDMSKAAKLVTFSGGATAKAVKLRTEGR